MNYKSIVQHLNFPEFYQTRTEWEYLYIIPTETCHTLQDFCNLITEYGINCQEIKIHSTDQTSWYVMFKKGGSIKPDFPGQVTIAEYTEDPVVTPVEPELYVPAEVPEDTATPTVGT